MNFRLFVDELRKRFLIVIGLMIVCALGLGAEKFFTAQSGLHLSGDAYIQCLMRLDSPFVSRTILDNEKFFTASQLEFFKFINETRDSFDYARLNGTWNGMSDVDKIIWLTKHLEITRYDPNVYVFALAFEASDAHDYEYVKENLPRFFDAYVEFAQRECRAAGVGELVLIDRQAIIPDGMMLTRKRIVFKYAAIGGALGLLVGLIVVFGLSARKLNDA